MSGRLQLRAAPRRLRLPRRLLLALLAGALLFSAASSAPALQIRAGDLIVTADGGFAPRSLPRHHDAPITLHGGGSLATVSGQLPPILKTITILFDRHGHVDTTGLSRCRRSQLLATDVAAARAACAAAIVGEGAGRAVVKFPEQEPIPVSSPITLFNGPVKHGAPTVFAHAYLSYPAPTTFIVPITIERIRDGAYGYRTEARIPPIAGGYGIPLAGHLTVGRRWTLHGAEHSYVNARCETGRLQARAEFAFADGTLLGGTFFRPCRVRR